MFKKFGAALCSFQLLSASVACGVTQSFVPQWFESKYSTAAPTMTEAEFNETLDKAEAYYGPLIKRNWGAKLNLIRAWKDNTKNAYAIQSVDRTGMPIWTVKMFGGLARIITKDGLLAVCTHELGHHLGAYPYTSGGWAAANEGQADTFSMLSGLRNIFGSEKDENAKYAAIIPATPKAKCEKAFAGLDDRNLCYRSMMAAKSVADFLSSGSASFDKQDKNQVRETDNMHPKGQCRLDTYVAGALCASRAHYNEDVISGKDLGAAKRNSAQAERNSASDGNSCHALNGDPVEMQRPRCWFAPLVKK